MKKGIAALMVSLLAAIIITPGLARAGDMPSAAVLFTPDKMVWKARPRNATLEVSDLVGDATKAGPYVQRVKFPPSSKVPPHTHPEDRTYTVVSGAWYIGWGVTCDEAKMIAVRPGRFYTEPADVPHCVERSGEPFVLQISGVGPSATNRLGASKKQEASGDIAGDTGVEGWRPRCSLDLTVVVDCRGGIPGGGRWTRLS